MTPDPSLEERVARLESMVAEIHARLVANPAPAAAESANKARSLLARGRSAPLPRAEAWAHRSEQWLGRVGLGLLFLGLVYLFNYSIEQGWITPLVRVAIGLLIGGVLLAFGLRLRSTRRSYSQILLAGALAVFYVTGFAASQLYLLVSYGAAFVYMAAVMALALALARRQDHPSLASLGALGGFATPLLLHRESAAVMELSVYGALVVAWTGALYWLRGWPALLWTYAVGGVAALSIAADHATGDERWAVQGSLLLTWALGAGLPFARGILKGVFGSAVATDANAGMCAASTTKIQADKPSVARNAKRPRPTQNAVQATAVATTKRFPPTERGYCLADVRSRESRPRLLSGFSVPASVSDRHGRRVL